MNSSIQDPQINQQPQPPRPDSNPIAGRRVSFIGKLGSMNRREVRELLKSNGALVIDKVDESVNLVVLGEDQLLESAEQLLDDWVIEAAAEGRVEIINETKLWQMLGLVDEDVSVCQLYTPAMLAKLLDLPIATIRRWHRRGLISPSRQVQRLPYFDFQEVASARRIARLIASGATPSAIESKLSRLAESYPDVARPLSQLSVIVEGKNVLLRQGEGLIEPGGQKRIDFDAIEDGAQTNSISELDSPPNVIAIQEPAAEPNVDKLTTPEEFIELAIQFEDDHELESATEIYRSMGLAFGPTADVAFRLAELLYQQGDLNGARERYYMAVELDDTFVEARASLGCVLVELGQSQLALSAFTGALEHHYDYPDVHFHLGHLYDELGKRDAAEPHWKKFLELAPHSPWADEARDRLNTSI